MQLTKKKSRIVFHALEALTAEQGVASASVRNSAAPTCYDGRR